MQNPGSLKKGSRTRKLDRLKERGHAPQRTSTVASSMVLALESAHLLKPVTVKTQSQQTPLPFPALFLGAPRK